jgi:hypothetical protein
MHRTFSVAFAKKILMRIQTWQDNDIVSVYLLMFMWRDSFRWIYFVCPCIIQRVLLPRTWIKLCAAHILWTTYQSDDAPNSIQCSFNGRVGKKSWSPFWLDLHGAGGGTCVNEPIIDGSARAGSAHNGSARAGSAHARSARASSTCHGSSCGRGIRELIVNVAIIAHSSSSCCTCSTSGCWKGLVNVGHVIKWHGLLNGRFDGVWLDKKVQAATATQHKC